MIKFVKPQYRKEYLKVKEEYLNELKKLVPTKGLKNVKGFKEKAYWVWNVGILKPQLHVIFGNGKLPETTCIVNLGTWFNCSGKKEKFCEICDDCYDKQIEVRFKERTKNRLEHEIYWRSVDAKTFALEIIKRILIHDNKNNPDKLNPKIKTKLVRWSEVGELRNQKDFEKVVECSNIIYNKLGIKSYIYTHNKNINFNIDRPNLTVNGSGFMVDNEYRVVKNKEKEFNNLYDLSNKRNCICDCTQCSYCSKKDGFIIIEELR